MVSVKNGVGVMPGGAARPDNFNQTGYQTLAFSENCFSTYNTPKFDQGQEFFPKLLVKRNPAFGQ